MASESLRLRFGKLSRGPLILSAEPVTSRQDDPPILSSLAHPPWGVLQQATAQDYLDQSPEFDPADPEPVPDDEFDQTQGL
jgi:hypothetical protein